MTVSQEDYKGERVKWDNHSAMAMRDKDSPHRVAVFHSPFDSLEYPVLEGNMKEELRWMTRMETERSRHSRRLHCLFSDFRPFLFAHLTLVYHPRQAERHQISS